MDQKKNILVLLSGCGVYDGAEIHESVLTLLHLDKAGLSYQCCAPNEKQHHVVNHCNGEEMEEERNMMVEAARIARGSILATDRIEIENYDALFIPGGFGAAKNLSKWAFSGPEGPILPEAERLIRSFYSLGKPVAALCMSPVVLSLAFKETENNPNLTVGSTAAPSPYDIQAISDGMESLGASASAATVQEVVVDHKNKLITSPCYMMEASIAEISEGIEQSVDALKKML